MLRRRWALTLSEVVLAVAISTIAVFALVSLQLASMRWKTKSSLQQQASLLASSVLDEKVSRLRLDFSYNVDETVHASSVAGFQQEVQAHNDGPENPPILKKLEVTISWKDRQGPQHYRLVTRVYKGS